MSRLDPYDSSSKKLLAGLGQQAVPEDPVQKFVKQLEQSRQGAPKRGTPNITTHIANQAGTPNGRAIANILGSAFGGRTAASRPSASNSQGLGLGGQLSRGRNQDIVFGLAKQMGWSSPEQLQALDKLVTKESSWNNTAQNPTSTAYGLFQFLNSTWGNYGQKTSDPTRQGQAGLQYIKDRYGDPLAALRFHLSHNWY